MLHVVCNPCTRANSGRKSYKCGIVEEINRLTRKPGRVRLLIMSIVGKPDLRGINLATHLRILMGTSVAVGRPEPEVKIRYRTFGRRWGTAYKNRNLIYLYVRPKHEWYHLVDTLAHELAHILAPAKSGHGPAWKRTFKDLVKEAYGFDIIPSTFVTTRPERLDQQLKTKIRTG